MNKNKYKQLKKPKCAFYRIDKNKEKEFEKVCPYIDIHIYRCNEVMIRLHCKEMIRLIENGNIKEASDLLACLESNEITKKEKKFY